MDNLEPDFSRSLKLKCEGAAGLQTQHDLVLVFDRRWLWPFDATKDKI